MGIERSIAMAIIEHFAPTGLSANKIINMARDLGGGYRRTDMLEDIRVAQGKAKNQYWVEKVAGNEVIPQGLMVEKDLGVDRKYRVYGTYTYYDVEDNNYYDVTRSFYVDDYASKDDWEDTFAGTFVQRACHVDEEYIGFNITSVEHNKGYKY